MTYDIKNPFKITIDKISITKNEIGINHVRIACDLLVEMARKNPIKLQLKAGRRHYLQGRLNIIGSSSPLLIQAGSRHSDVLDYRIEFNPSRLGEDGLSQIREFLDEVTYVGFDRFVTGGKITRIDLALDLPGLDLEDVIIRSKGQRKHGVYTGSGGKLESAYQGSPKANGTVSYNKEDDFGDTGLRLERRLKAKCLGSELIVLPNPFNKIEMISTASVVRHLDGMMPQQFFDSVRMRGFPAVLTTLPRKQRTAILAALADPSQTLLPPMDLIWQRWPSLLLECLQIGSSSSPQQAKIVDDGPHTAMLSGDKEPTRPAVDKKSSKANHPRGEKQG